MIYCENIDRNVPMVEVFAAPSSLIELKAWHIEIVFYLIHF
jgi:hypothetical protein